MKINKKLKNIFLTFLISRKFSIIPILELILLHFCDFRWLNLKTFGLVFLLINKVFCFTLCLNVNYYQIKF